MNQAKAKKLLRNQTPLAIKVYEAVPVGETWPRNLIFGELDRLGTPIDMRQLEGCLYSLVNDGLIKEPSKGQFIRQKISVPAEKPKIATLHLADKKSDMKFVLEEEVVTMVDPVDSFDKLKQTLNGVAASLTETIDAIDRCKEMADDIALKCMEAQEGNNEELKKLRALKAALKELS